MMRILIAFEQIGMMRRATERAASFPGICEAAADQWGGYALQECAA